MEGTEQVISCQFLLISENSVFWYNEVPAVISTQLKSARNIFLIEI